MYLTHTLTHGWTGKKVEMLIDPCLLACLASGLSHFYPNSFSPPLHPIRLDSILSAPCGKRQEAEHLRGLLSRREKDMRLSLRLFG